MEITTENIREKFEDLVNDLNTLRKFCGENGISWSIYNDVSNEISGYLLEDFKIGILEQKKRL